MSPYRAEAMLNRYGAHEKIADLYDDDEDLRAALNALFPDFEYPNFSHLTVGEALKRYIRSLVAGG